MILKETGYILKLLFAGIVAGFMENDNDSDKHNEKDNSKKLIFIVLKFQQNCRFRQL